MCVSKQKIRLRDEATKNQFSRSLQKFEKKLFPRTCARSRRWFRARYCTELKNSRGYCRSASEFFKKSLKKSMFFWRNFFDVKKRKNQEFFPQFALLYFNARHARKPVEPLFQCAAAVSHYFCLGSWFSRFSLFWGK